MEHRLVKNKGAKLIGKAVGGLLAFAVAVFLVLLLYMTITEYKPKEIEEVEVLPGADASIQLEEGTELEVMTWNIGYCGLGESEDFFMDGGKGVMVDSKQKILDNLSCIAKEIQNIDPDIALFQEVDLNSKRSYFVNQLNGFKEAMPQHQGTFAYNYRVDYVPYPLPTIGKVESGVATLCRYKVGEACRIRLPNPFRYPYRLGNLKRGLLVQRIPIKESEKELVVINLHLEAYDSGEGKRMQTEMLRKVMQEEIHKGNYVIAGGDFNQSFMGVGGESYPIIDETAWKPGEIDTTEFGDGVQFLNDSSVPTCRSLNKPYKDADKESFQYYMLDGFVISDNLQVEEVKTISLDFVNSDHNPVVLKVKI